MNSPQLQDVTIDVVAVNLDQRLLTLYKTDGTTLTIPQGDQRIQGILDVAVPICAAGKVATVVIGKAPDQTNHYSEMEEKTGGLVKFFRVAKSKLKEFFGSQEPEEPVFIEPIKAGVVPGEELTVSEVAVPVADVQKLDEAVPAKTQAAVDEIMRHAIPAKSEAFDRPHERENLEKDGAETIIAMVGNQIVPDVQNLKSQIKAGNKEGATTVGLQRFLERCAAVASKRSHSVEDLMKFMEKGDLPIADDGSIVIYKILRKGNDGHDGFDYVDCHTRKVPQRVGSYVFMAENLVDHNRNNECSNGLHVARRSYVGNFGGDVCVLAKVNPEDVIAVPTYDANKMRVAGYHILAELPKEAYQLLREGKPMTSLEECKVLLGKVLAGDHAEATNTVEITGQMGAGIRVVEFSEYKTMEEMEASVETMDDVPAEAPVSEPEAPVEEAAPAPVRMAEALPDEPAEDDKPKLGAPVVDPKALAKQVTATAKPVSKLAGLVHAWVTAITPAENQAAAVALVAYKKSSKKSWAVMGFTEADVDAIQRHAGVAATPVVKAKGKSSVVKGARPSASKPKTSPSTGKPVSDVTELTKDELLLRVPQGDKAAAQELFNRRRAKKKSWHALGYTSKQIDMIEKLLK